MDIKETTYLEARLQGKNKAESAMAATGTKDKKVANVQAHRIESKPAFQQALQALLRTKGITLSKALTPIAEALTATKVHIVGNGDDAMAEIVVDHAIRLQASDRALKLLQIADKQPQSPDYTDIHEAIKDNMDEVELTRAVFKKKEV